MRYMMFDEAAEFTEEDGSPCDLGAHLAYLRKWGGTPDSIENFDSLNAAKAACRNELRTVIVIDEMADFRPVYRFEYQPDAAPEISEGPEM